MNKKILSLVLCGIISMPMVGCNLNITTPSNEENVPKQYVEQQPVYEQEREYSDEEIIYFAEAGVYTISIDGYGEYEYEFGEVLNALFGEPQYSVQPPVGDSEWYKLSVKGNASDMLLVMNVNFDDLEIAKLHVDGQMYEGIDALDKFGKVIAQLILDGKLSTEGKEINNYEKNTEQKEEPKQEEKKEETKQETNNGFYKGSDGQYHCNQCGTVPSKEEYNSGSCATCNGTAKYGHCPRCNVVLDGDKAHQWGYCDSCFADVKAEDWAEKTKYGYCVDCGVILTKNQAESYGDRCAECYAKHYDPNFDSNNLGHCDRCGELVDMRYTNEGWGYNNLCSACTGQLQEQESMEDWSPYAG